MEREISYYDGFYKREINGSYVVEKGVITVRSAYGSRGSASRWLCDESAPLTAILLRELAAAARKDGQT